MTVPVERRSFFAMGDMGSLSDTAAIAANVVVLNNFHVAFSGSACPNLDEQPKKKMESASDRLQLQL
jgi:hypothetical protein